MSQIRSRDSAPELVVRKLVYQMGYRYRLYSYDLPGRPDLVFRNRKKVIFVHGCFWHCHSNCIDGRIPKSNVNYWGPKLARNKGRDRKVARAYKKLGWKILVIWECETQSVNILRKKLQTFLSSS